MNFAKQKRTVIIIQARMGSTRLPGKILKKIMGRPLIEYQIERLKKIENADNIAIATTVHEDDQIIVDLCKQLGYLYFRGSENDVLSRYVDAAIKFDAELIVRINADCPLIDPNVVEKVIKYFHDNFPKYDYVSNILNPSYPIGYHTEVFSLDSIKKAHKNTKDLEEREHVTPYIYRNPKDFNIGSVELEVDFSHHRWTVDYEEDFKLIKTIIEGIYPSKADFNMYDTLDYLNKHPELNNINNGIIKDQILV